MDNQAIHDLAEILRAVVDLQIKQTKATAAIAAHLNLQREVERAQRLAGDEESQLLQSLRDRIQTIIQSVSKTPDRKSGQ